MIMKNLQIITCLAVLISSGVASQASAADQIVVETGVIGVADLNVATEKGAEALVRRVTAKATDLCTPVESPLARPDPGGFRQCVAQAVARPLIHVDAPLVTAVYAHRFGAAPSEVASR
jgi:UrcA family protein